MCVILTLFISFYYQQKMKELFQQALAYIKNLPSEPQPGQPQLTNQHKLDFYALFKQATEGPNKTKAPSRLRVVQKMKWDAWNKLGKMSKQDAMKSYVQQLTKVVPNWNASAKL